MGSHDLDSDFRFRQRAPQSRAIRRVVTRRGNGLHGFWSGPAVDGAAASGMAQGS